MLPEKLGFSILEPIKELYKDEVRKVGLELNLPSELLWRHPFPGPGLAVRIVGEVTKELLEILREADAILYGGVKKVRRIQRDMASICSIATCKSSWSDG